ncbi:MAG: FAD-dependent oxidoreductase [Methylacidiphilales bacterium]|nr:FAD-dependent oxidoreductase [Candidatus Methylacidiphilales bacterium]
MVKARRSFLINSALGLGAFAIPKTIWASKNLDAEVLVLGAGLSGLRASMILDQYNISSVTLEGSDRVGGRVRTLNTLPGKPDVGANQIGSTYGEFLYLANAFGLSTVDDIPAIGSRTQAVYIDTVLLHAHEWNKHPKNKLIGKERDIPFGAWLSTFLPSPLEVSNLDFYGTTNSVVPDMSVLSYLQSKGASDQIIKLMQMNFNGSFERFSLQDLYRRMIIRKAAGTSPAMYLKDGLEQLPTKMAGTLKRPVLFNKQVTAIKHDKSYYTVSCSDGTTYRSSALLCALPLSILQKLRLDLPINNSIQEGINSVQYLPVTRSFFIYDVPFWEKDGFSSEVWTDTPLGFLHTTKGNTDTPAKLYGSYAIGKQAHAMDMLLQKDRNAPLKLLEQVRPSSKGKVQLLQTVSWGTNPFSYGAFSSYTSGTIASVVSGFRNQKGSCIFAGEHTESSFASGMEGAINSGSKAATLIAQSLGKL